MNKSGFTSLVSIDKARELIRKHICELGNEKVSLDLALNRVLATDTIAPIDVPHFRKSAMDGYALIAQDTFGTSDTKPKKLKVIGVGYPGRIPGKTVTRGTCIEIATGAPLPKGANAVLMVEYSERDGNNLIIYKTVAPEENLIAIGSDIKKGTRVLRKGFILNPRYTGVLSSLGMKEVMVKKKPIVAVLSTGDELITSNEKLREGKIYEINSRTIIDSLKQRGCEVVNLGISRDYRKDIEDKILKGVKKAHLLIISGGSSLGAEDMINEIVSSLGKVLVHGIAIKPGKPTVIGIIKGKIVLGLPGYPTSALSNFYILIVPVLCRMLGVDEKINSVEAKLARKVASTVGRYHFMPVSITEEKGDNYATPILKGSSAITTLANADGFVEIPENVEVINKGDKLRVRLF